MTHEPYVGEIRLFGGAFAPDGWIACDGRFLPISSYHELYGVIGTRFGASEDGFAVPALESRAPGLTYMIASVGRAPRP